MSKHILITNLDYVTIGPVRTFTHALLLADTRDKALGSCRARGFSTDPTLPTFDIEIPSIDHTLELVQSNNLFIRHDGEARPRCSGAILTFADNGPVLQLVTCTQERFLDVYTFEEEDGYDIIWRRLREMTRKYWHAPYMPRVQWGPR